MSTSIRTRQVRRAIVAVAACLAVGAMIAPAASAADTGRPFTVAMSGAEEAPGPGDPDGTGTATLAVNPGLGQICYTLSVTDIAPATAAHIHVAPVGVAGPVVVGLTPPTDGSSAGCVDVARDLAVDIIRNPSAYYVNVHNAEFMAGAVRGQLG